MFHPLPSPRQEFMKLLDGDMAESVTVRDVARSAGVSAGTVSRVLNGHENVADTLRTRVLRAVEETGYAATRAGRSRRPRHHAEKIGFLLSLPYLSAQNGELMSPFWAHILQGSEEEANLSGARVAY